MRALVVVIARTIGAFPVRLRGDVEVDAVRADLISSSTAQEATSAQRYGATPGRNVCRTPAPDSATATAHREGLHAVGSPRDRRLDGFDAMSERREARLRAAALAVACLSGGLALIALAFVLLNLDAAASLGTAAFNPTYTTNLIVTLVGLLIAWRHPVHLVAWTFLAIGLSAEILNVFWSYGFYGTVTDPGSLPGADILSWVTSWGFVIPASGFLFALLVFPNGRLIGRRWWFVVWLIVAGMGFLGAGSALGRESGNLFRHGPLLSAQDLERLLRAGGALLTAGISGAGASLIVRYRRARTEERLQLKWVVYAGCAALVMMLVGVFLFTQPEPVRSLFRPFTLSPILIPIAAAIAILRYRLYDIDVLINRTIVYGAVSAMLAATYIAAVVLLQALLRPVTEGSQVAVALSTLLVVTLFQPIRRRAQDVVDRRFYRARYDAARTIDAFAVRLRSDVELDSVRADLIATIHDTVRPAHVSVWLRSAR
jgi:hypothetical protein